MLSRKSCLKFLEDIKTKTIHIPALPTPVWLKFSYETSEICVLILQRSSKFVGTAREKLNKIQKLAVKLHWSPKKFGRNESLVIFENPNFFKVPQLSKIKIFLKSCICRIQFFKYTSPFLCLKNGEAYF